ncbi:MULTISPECIES: cytochrome c biogenesis CcdA family protein [Aurantimonadaceae]|uniref:Cytochrome c biogenesis CcdA family protein n=1 Tax=Jiella pelagia TaxID=2986949 RepID=A0ABY7C6W7_9HYPH|nr:MULTISPECIES: cytochrome c biogenesis CcdA family protein [Aurantimonadaceae]ORE97003.1 Cytochrome c biogenesis protein [Aurantimonas sp. 22II-16-19i]WAP71423.1 cytochrome c biogenesis CcdA family protein [Jiella pelagia]
MLEISNVGILTALAAGAISFLSPCVLPLVPGYISYVAGNAAVAGRPNQSLQDRWTTLLLSTYFVLGFSTVFVALGASATAISRLLLSYRYETNIIGGAIIIVFGIFMTGLVRLPWLQRELRFHGDLAGGRPLGAYVLGLAFGFGWTPCIGPVLGAILTISALSSTASNGVALLGIYSVGLGVPFLLSALFTESLAKRLKGMRRTGRLLQIGAGMIMIIMGVAMITGTMSTFSFWLLEQFPILTKIG